MEMVLTIKTGQMIKTGQIIPKVTIPTKLRIQLMLVEIQSHHQMIQMVNPRLPNPLTRQVALQVQPIQLLNQPVQMDIQLLHLVCKTPRPQHHSQVVPIRQIQMEQITVINQMETKQVAMAKTITEKVSELCKSSLTQKWLLSTSKGTLSMLSMINSDMM